MDLGITYVPSTKNKVIAEINGHLYSNHVEGWHFRMNNFLSGSHPDMWKCLELLQSEQHHWELETAKIASGIRKPFVRKYQQLNVQ